MNLNEFLFSEGKFDVELIQQKYRDYLNKAGDQAFEPLLWLERIVGLQKLGSGSARTVFLIDSKRVLKWAGNVRSFTSFEKGRAQNKAELEVSQNSEFGNLIAKIYRHDGWKYDWLLSELVRPITNTKEFKQLTGMHYRNFHHALYGEEERVNDQKTFTNPFFLEIKKLIEAENLITGDVAKYDHYGKTADGRVVLYDYGYTSDVWEKLYKDK